MTRTFTKTAAATLMAAALPFAAVAEEGTAEASTKTELQAPLNWDNKVQVGELTCVQEDRENLIVFSKAKFDCSYTSAETGNVESYTGTATKVGVDLTAEKVETMVWYVFAPTSGLEAGGLEGNFIGATADASLGAGGGGHVLIGGLDRSFALQPAAFSGTTGIGASIGVEKFNLDYDG
ncbi:DUF992 domain-containing protein [Neptunicoccus cionae]|uniref:DUF992 domain-containing protein n=1 Tax=Neptunicoccus cionae TaxID=2035344 RepID=UPI000C756A85|nr:DUF992 domain-containing protein [Amylibacter cionae]PLS20816.1 DUF992 domain-containing protein [Amylibacter cionae]